METPQEQQPELDKRPEVRFSEDARQTLRDAEEEARKHNHNYIGTEHLFLALTRGIITVPAESSGINYPISPEEVNELIKKLRPIAEFLVEHDDRPSAGKIELTPRAKNVIRLALNEATFGRPEITRTCILTGLLLDGEIVDKLKSFNIDRGIDEVGMETTGAIIYTVGLAKILELDRKKQLNPNQEA